MRFCVRKKTIILFVIIVLPVVLARTALADQVFPAASSSTASTTAQNLQQMIDQKNQELNQIDLQKQALTEKMDQIGQSKNTLSNEVQNLNYKIDQVNLQIKASQLTSQRISLEVQSLNDDIATAQDKIRQRKQVIAQLMVELEQRDKESPFLMILGSSNLSDGVNRATSIYTLNKSLVDSLSELTALQDSLKQEIADINGKKTEQKSQEVNLVNVQYILQDQVGEKNSLLSMTKSQEQYYQEQMDQLDEQQRSINDVIQGIEDQLRASFNPNVLPSTVHSTLSFPVENVIITQGYGYTKFAKGAYASHFHNGVDIGVPIGTPVYAAADGMVLRVDNNDTGSAKWQHYLYGKYIVVGHDDNLATLYGHLSRQVVKAGDIIKRGQLIGYSGDTGYAFGPHVHFGVFWRPKLKFVSVSPARGLIPVGVTVDPMVYLPDAGFKRVY